MNDSAPVGRQQITKDSTQYLAATIIAQGVGMIRAFVIPVLFSPAQLGIWNLMGVILSYGANAHLGLLHGMNKAIPLLRGQGKVEELEAIKNSVFWLNLLLGALAGGMLWVASLIVPASYVSGLRVIAVVMFLQMIFYYLFSLLRADNRFGLVSQGVGVLSIFSTVLILLLAFSFADHLLGALIGLAGAYGVVVAYWFGKGRYRFVFRLSLGSIREALTLGVPLIILGVLDTVLLSVDRGVIAANLGEATLGYYALGIMGSNLLSLVPGAAATVLYPRMLERFAVARDPGAPRSLLMVPLRALAVLMPLLVVGVALGLPLLIQLFVPKYLPSVPIIEILIPGAFFLSTALVAGNYLVAINKQRLLINLQIAATLFILVVDTILLRAGYGVIGVALGTAAGYSIYGLSQTILAVNLALGQKAETIRFVARLLIPFIAMVLAIPVAGFLIWEGATPLGYVLSAARRLVLVMSVLLPVLWLVNRDVELGAMARTELQAWLAARSGRA